MSDFRVFRVSEGLGNACAFHFPDGSLGVVDWGTQHPEPLAFLGLTASTRVRFILASHAHADHTLGLPMLLNACLAAGAKVDKLVYPAATLRSGAKDYLTQARQIAYAHKIPMCPIQISLFASLDGKPAPLVLAEDEAGAWRILVLSPPSDLVSREEVAAWRMGRATGNVTSVVALYQTLGAGMGKGSILLPGDAEPRTLEFARSLAQQDGRVTLDCDLFLVPHHGSRHNFPEWLHAYLHGHVAISATHDSPHHPAQTVLQAVSAGCKAKGASQVFCTSYALACRQAFAASTEHANRAVCFGDMRFRAGAEGTNLVDSVHDGERLRGHGHCGV